MRKRPLLLLFAVLACGGDDPIGVGSSSGAGRTARQPIVFVHGLEGSAADWTGMIERFKREGWSDGELIAATYPSDVSNTVIAAIIRDRVDSVLAATFWDKADLVTYSMGSLSSRYYLKNLGGTARVDAWVSIAGPNRGTVTASLCSQPGCVEMLPSSAFLEALNAVDETPGEVRYATWMSRCDEMVVPWLSTRLVGAVNTETICLAHESMLTTNIYQEVRAFIAP